MLKPSLPFFPFLFFFFLQQHFLIMQKQQVRMSKAATTAMAIRAHGGTVIFKTTEGKLRLGRNFTNCISYDTFDQIKSTLTQERVFYELLTWDFINFIQEFALDFFKHVILVDLCVVGAGGVNSGGDDSRGGSHGHGGGTGGLCGCHSLWPSEQVELHCQRLGAASLKHTDIKHEARISNTNYWSVTTSVMICSWKNRKKWQHWCQCSMLKKQNFHLL